MHGLSKGLGVVIDIVPSESEEAMLLWHKLVLRAGLPWLALQQAIVELIRISWMLDVATLRIVMLKALIERHFLLITIVESLA